MHHANRCRLLMQTKLFIHNEDRGSSMGRKLEICLLTLIARIKLSRKISEYTALSGNIHVCVVVICLLCLHYFLLYKVRNVSHLRAAKARLSLLDIHRVSPEHQLFWCTQSMVVIELRSLSLLETCSRMHMLKY